MSVDEIMAEINQMVDEVRAMVRPDHWLSSIDAPDKMARFRAALYIDPIHLPRLLADDSPMVRRIVAERIDEVYLPQLIDDYDDIVQEIVYKRIPAELVPASCMERWKLHNVERTLDE